MYKIYKTCQKYVFLCVVATFLQGYLPVDISGDWAYQAADIACLAGNSKNSKTQKHVTKQ